MEFEKLSNRVEWNQERCQNKLEIQNNLNLDLLQKLSHLEDKLRILQQAVHYQELQKANQSDLDKYALLVRELNDTTTKSGDFENFVENT